MDNKKDLCVFEKCMLFTLEHIKECIILANDLLPVDKQLGWGVCESGFQDFADFVFGRDNKIFAGIIDVADFQDKGIKFRSDIPHNML